MNYGLIESIIDVNTHWFLGDGSLTPEILQPDGQWDAFLPIDEVQRKGSLETENCTSYGTLHALCTLGKRKFGPSFQNNLSERFQGIVAKTTPQGNDPHKVAESIRLLGVVPEVYLPFSDAITTWQAYYGPKPLPYWLWAMGQHWIGTYQFNHEWLYFITDTPETKQQKMMTALQSSPLGASVFAWSQHSDGTYYSDQPYKNHWITIYGYLPDGRFKVFDSYTNTHKLLDANFDFGQVKRYALTKNVGSAIINPLGYLPYYLGALFS